MLSPPTDDHPLPQEGLYSIRNYHGSRCRVCDIDGTYVWAFGWVIYDRPLPEEIIEQHDLYIIGGDF